MVDTLQAILTNADLRSHDALVEKFSKEIESATPWFD